MARSWGSVGNEKVYTYSKTAYQAKLIRQLRVQIKSLTVQRHLWHYRIGYPSGAAMQYIESLPKKIHPHVHDHYDICPLVNQHQLTFPVHSTKVVALFDLVHLDV